MAHCSFLMLKIERMLLRTDLKTCSFIMLKIERMLIRTDLKITKQQHMRIDGCKYHFFICFQNKITARSSFITGHVKLQKYRNN